jgi:tetratricopeptide (TPR) repeat protein
LTAQQLGTIDFPTSAPAAAQAPFIRGVLFLHSFEYESAAQAFMEAQRIAPDFAMAYWGEAMTYTHPVWNEQDVSKARAALTRLGATAAARRAKAGTDREKMYLDAVEALYGEGSKARRDTMFAAAVERVAAAFPSDDEAQAFHALALLGLNQGVRDTTTYLRAGAIAQAVLGRNRDHPGGAHYTIHAYDDPIHASLGLSAARLYSKIAPAAPHAQHMTTHIFLAMGMWDDVVSQNIVASGHDHAHYQAGHYTAWLGYGYAQQGRMDEARKHLETVRANYRRTARRGEEPSLLSMRAHYLINSERWKDPVVDWRLEAPNAGPVATGHGRICERVRRPPERKRPSREADARRPGPSHEVGAGRRRVFEQCDGPRHPGTTTPRVTAAGGRKTLRGAGTAARSGDARGRGPAGIRAAGCGKALPRAARRGAAGIRSARRSAARVHARAVAGTGTGTVAAGARPGGARRRGHRRGAQGVR